MTSFSIVAQFQHTHSFEIGSYSELQDAIQDSCGAGCARGGRVGSDHCPVCVARLVAHDHVYMRAMIANIELGSPAVQQSVLLVLATALPADSRSYALASSSAFAAEMGSSLAAGNTPAWYQALPSDVKSLLPALYPVSTPAATTSSVSASAYPTPMSSVSAHPSSGNSSAISSVRMPTLSATKSAPAKTSVAVATGAAAYPTAAVGASLGAVLGFLGMLAL